MQSISEEDEVDYAHLAFVASQAPWSPPPRLFIKKMVIDNPQRAVRLLTAEWSPIASAFLTASVLVLSVSLSHCLPPKQPPTPPPTAAVTLLRACLAAWGLALLHTHIVRRGKHWTLTMFPLWTWGLLCLRMCSLTLAAAAPAPLAGALAFCGNSVRFAVMCQAALTAGLWWGAGMPLAWHKLDAEGRRRLLAVNLGSAVWLSLRSLVLPLAAAEWWMTGGAHALWELWVQAVLAGAFLIVYLFVADPRLWHWYPFLSPRSHWCGFVYALFIGAMIGFFLLLNEHTILTPPKR